MREYYQLVKPGIIFGNSVTAAAGFALASKGKLLDPLFLMMLVGLSLIIASACICNNYIDRKIDEKMARTKNRPLVKGVISVKKAFSLALLFLLGGSALLGWGINLLTLFLALVGFAVYVGVYSFLKPHSSQATLIGSVAGAIPPVVGYCAKIDHLDGAAFLLFAIVFLWQMPHFFAIALYRIDEYAAAAIPILPLKRGVERTKIQMVLYIGALLGATALLTFEGYTGYAYLIVSVLLTLLWLGLGLKGLKAGNDRRWARQMFLFSLVVIMGLSVMISVDVV